MIMEFKRLDITVNAGCKVNCNYCPHTKTIPHLKGSHYNMTFETFKDCLKTVPNVVQICFAGFSEPFLNDDCLDMILYAEKCGYPIIVYTTTVGLDTEKLKQIEHIKFVSFEVHMPTKSGGERIFINNTYKSILKQIYETINETHFTFICNNNQDELLDLIPFVSSEFIHIEMAHSRAGNNEYFSSIPIKKGKLLCDRGLVSNVLLPNGDISICCQDFGAKHIIGNLLQQSYQDIFYSKAFIDFQNKMQIKDSYILCRKCEYAIQTT